MGLNRNGLKAVVKFWAIVLSIFSYVGILAYSLTFHTPWAFIVLIAMPIVIMLTVTAYENGSSNEGKYY